jgi:ribosome-binding factor A
MANPQRLRRVADQIQRELSDILRAELKDPRVGMITLTGVEVSPDFAHAKVFFTSLADVAQRDDVRAGLKRAGGFLRTMLGARLKIHNTPELHFVYDESVESGIRLTHLIEDAVAADAERGRPRRRATRTR